MKKNRLLWTILLLLAAGAIVLAIGKQTSRYFTQRETAQQTEQDNVPAGNMTGKLLENARDLLRLEPKEVRNLRKQEVETNDSGYQEYYFQKLNQREQRGYRELLAGIRSHEEQFYLTVSGDEEVDRVYHAVLKDHPELYWVHNRKQVYKTTYSGEDYCRFSPGYTYSEEERAEIDQSMEDGYQAVRTLIPEGASVYEIVKIVYTYLIDHVEYRASDDDQSIAGVFWKKEAVCAGYAGATQYLLERLGIPCIYVEGSAEGSDEGHAWNIVQIEGQYYYVDTTNGDQPEFLEGEAAQLEEHKTIIYDYLCPFPWEYERTYTPSEEFSVPECTSADMNFYVLNDGCFDIYDPQQLYEYCKMRLDNGAAVVRFKFSAEEAFQQAKADWVSGEEIQNVARYYMELNGLNQIEYHYGILQNLKSMYFMF